MRYRLENCHKFQNLGETFSSIALSIRPSERFFLLNNQYVKQIYEVLELKFYYFTKTIMQRTVY